MQILIVSVYKQISSTQSLSSYKNLIICGDFNVPDINWNVLSGSTSFSSDLCDLIVDLNLTQHVTVPTHKGGNILDIILTNYDIEELSVNPDLPPNTTSNHFLITFFISTQFDKTQTSCRYLTYDYSKVDWEGVYSFIEHHNFGFYYQLTDVESLWRHLKQTLAEAIEVNVPKFLLRKHQRPK